MCIFTDISTENKRAGACVQTLANPDVQDLTVVEDTSVDETSVEDTC